MGPDLIERKRGRHGGRTWLELATTVALLLASAVVLGQRLGLVPQPAWWSTAWANVTGSHIDAASVPLVGETIPPGDPLSLDGAALRGNLQATVGMLVFEEYECPWCLRLEQTTLPGVVRDYVDTGRVLLALRHFPLQLLHPHALKASEAAECAGRQGRYWEMHASLFSRQDLDDPALVARAKDLGLQLETFVSCLAGEATKDVLEDQTLGASLGVTGTPTLFFGTMNADGTLTIRRRLKGAWSFEALGAVLEDMLATAAADKAAEDDSDEP